ncbi:hypothetical protein ACVGVM_24775 [Pseudonocardia bannensis]|uniref:SurA-like protein n=1 Tax=Pseudonocardia bannensis TaxID=630973 RepID=A0A848DD25_9PSEU|nr:hypothetical protein [Pseudonocardia bannensis]NMH90483.1 hypothetical protein [Pseudonocardia bannensis]
MAVAVAVVGAVVSGCGSGPSQVGSAVIVGADAVPLAEVQSRLDVALAKTEAVSQLASRGVGSDDIARDVVSRAVVHDLLARTAAAEGIVISDAQIDAELAANGGAELAVQSSLYDLPALRERVRDELVAAELARRHIDGLAVTVDVAAATSREDAEAKARAIAAGGAAADAVFAVNAQRGLQFRATSDPEAAAMAFFGTTDGRIVVFQPAPEQSGWIVLRVAERRTDAPPAGPSVASQIDQATLVKIGERMLQPLADEIGVRVNPRYGVWDPIRLRVVAEGQEAGAILTPPSVG